MIIPMKKLSLLLFHRDREAFLHALQELGVVHVAEDPERIGEGLESVDTCIRSAERVAVSLRRLAKLEHDPVAQATDRTVESVIAAYEDLEAQIEKAEQHIQITKKEIQVLRPWGDFDPAAVKRLRDVGVSMRFYQAPEQQYSEIASGETPVEEIGREGKTVYFAVVQRGEPQPVDAEEVTLPERSLSQCKQALAALEQERAAAHDSLVKLTAYDNVLTDYIEHESSKRDFEAARLSMEGGAEGAVLHLTGWVPHTKEKAVRSFLDERSVWYSLDEPTQDEEPPVMLKNNKTSSLFEPIINIYSLPDYFELDPTPFIAPFFAFFFGLSLGDLGYGILLILIALFGIVKGPSRLKPFMYLGLVLGGATAVSGVFLNTFFGAPLFAAAGDSGGILQEGGVLAMLSPVQTERGTYFPAMPFSMYLGVVQLTIGLFIKMAVSWRTEGPAYAIEPFSSAMMIAGLTMLMAKIDFIDMGKLTLGPVSIGPALAGVPDGAMLAILFCGLGLFLLFNSPSKKIFIRPLLGLWGLYNFASGLMSYSLSYLRLFALGLAGGLLGAAFNQIAFMFITSDAGEVNYGSPLIIATILVLLVGHSLNLALAALGAFVHPLRLTFVEFYGISGFKGGGKPYKAFAKPAKAAQ
jgi:V/A-type H+-transporting ATPase subunit I